MSDEFKVHRLSAEGLAVAEAIALKFTLFLSELEAVIPVGRERALVVTKLQEACFYAKRAIAMKPENQAE